MSKSIFIFFCCVLISACVKKDEYADLNCATIPASYKNDIAPIISASCLSACCHGAGTSNGNLSTYEGLMIRVKNGSLNKRVLVVKDMPQNREALTLEERRKIKCWLESGAVNN